MARHIPNPIARRLPAARLRVTCSLFVLLLPLVLSAGCGAAPTNPSFAVSVPDAQRALGEMRTEPKPLVRPLVVLGGMNDPGLASGMLRSEFRKLTGDDRVIGVSFAFCGDFDACRKQVVRAVDRAFPCDDPDATTEVDVLAVSMGGLVARYAAVPSVAPAEGESGPRGRRLRIARLFTISSPHRGAAWAVLPALGRLHFDMRPNSKFLRELTDAESAAGAYEIYPYVRLGDAIVGAPNAAPHGQRPWWVPGEMFQDAHIMAALDARILADVARRLRGEEPLTSYPPEPLPGEVAPPDSEPQPASDPADPVPAAPDHHAAGTAASGTTFALR